MPPPVLTGAQVMCSFGLMPSTVVAMPKGVPVTIESRPPLTILDNIGMSNILPFGLCTSLTNPITAAQTSIASGVLTPGPCTPIVPAPWTPGAPMTLINGSPALTMGSMCNCIYGGVINIVNPGATQEIVS